MVKPKKISRKRLGARYYKNYTEEMLDLAVGYVKNKKMSSREAEKRFGIPRRTLLNKVKDLHQKKIGPPTRLTEEEEKNIVKVAVAAGDFGCPLSKLDLRILVYEYLKKNGREAVFHGKLPGKQWISSFLERNASELTVRSCQNIKKARAEKSVEEFFDYFKNLEETVKDVPPSNILNLDETNLNDDPGSSKCIFRRGVKYPERVLNSTKGAVSLMFSASAAGMNLPPYVVYKSENLYSEWITGGPRGTRYNRTKSGWFDSSTFEDYFKTVVLKWAESLPEKKVVICDNLSSHLNVDIIKLCEEHNISFVFIPASSTHLTQPLDVAFFAPLKKAWRKILLQYKMENPNQTSLNKNHFPKLLTSLINAIDLTEAKNIKSGFKAAGICPLNPREVLKRLPEYAEDIGNYTVDNALLDYLQKCRQPKPITVKRNKKVLVEPGKSVSISDFDLLSYSNQEVTDTQKLKKNNGIWAKKSKTTKNKTSIINQDDRENNNPIFDLFSDNTAIEQPINDKDETNYDNLGEDILNDSNILLNLTCDFDKIDKLEVPDSKKREIVTRCILDENTRIINTNTTFDEINKINDEPKNKENEVETSCTLDKKGKIIASNNSGDTLDDNVYKFTIELEDQGKENSSRYILNEKTGILQYTIVTKIKQVINNKPVLRDKIMLTSSKDMYTETVTEPKLTGTFKNDTKVASNNICPNIVNILPCSSISEDGSTQQIIDFNEKRDELNANNLNMKECKYTKDHENLQDSKQNILNQKNTSTNETKVILETDKNTGKEKTLKQTDLNKEIHKCADTKTNTKRKSGKKITNQPKKKIKRNKSTTKPKTKPARRIYNRIISETSNSDINISTHSDSDICEIESDKSDSDIQSLNAKKPKTESIKDKKTTIAVKTEKPSSSYNHHLSEACSNINYAVGDIVLVRYFLEKKVDYFVGLVIAKEGNNKVKVSFFKKTGRSDNTKFIKTKKQEEKTIDCKNIVKTLNLLTINTSETKFVLDDEDDYLYFDY